MKIHHATRPYLSIFAWMLMLPILSISTNAQPQTFEFAYGSPTCIERGLRGVEPVNQQTECENGGYIAVGTSSEPLDETGCGEDCYLVPGTCDDNVYVVRTNADGTRMWEYVYDIGWGGPGSYDEGVVIREMATGEFIIAGHTYPNGVSGAHSEIFLMKIDCDGTPIEIGPWNGPVMLYGASNVNEYATDLIIATNGNGTTTNAGDFVVSGWADRPSPNMADGVLLRTTSFGVPIWNRTYNIPGTDLDQHEDYFLTLIEDQTAGTGIGDIIAAGYTKSFTFIGSNFYADQALVVRVNGNTGDIGPAPQGVAHFGGLVQHDRFDAIEELVGNPETGNLVFAGRTGSDIYLVKTAAHPCQQLAQNVVGTASGAEEAAFGIVQVSTALMPFAPFGHLAVVGRITLDCPSGDPLRHTNALLLQVNPFTFAAGAARQFGAQFGCRNEVFFSVMDAPQNDPGFIMCGYTQDNPPMFSTSPAPDPQELYLVKTDGNGATGCQETWSFNQEDPRWSAHCVTAIGIPTLLEHDRVPVYAEKNHPEEVCPFDGELRIAPPVDELNLGGLQERKLDVQKFENLLLPTAVKKESDSDKESTGTGTIQARGNR